MFNRKKFTSGAKPSAKFKFNQYHKGRQDNSRSIRLKSSVKSYISPKLKYYLLIILRIGLVLVFIRFGFIYSTTVEIRSVNPESINVSHYSRWLNDFLSKSWYRRFKPLADTTRINQEFQNEFSGVEESLINITPTGTLVLSIIEREPVAVVDYPSSSLTYIMDRKGVLYLDSFVDTASLIKVSDLSGIKPNAGEVGISTGSLGFITKFVELSRLNQALHNRVQDSWRFELVSAPREVRARSSNLGGYYFKLSLDRGVNDQISEINEVLDYLRTTGQQPAIYIDLRISDTVYIK